MPKYDYRCTSCGVTYERRESFDAPQEHACNECGAVARRVFVAPTILFKGSGWYINDSKTAESNAVSRAAKNGDGASSETKPSEAAAPAKETGSDTTSGSATKGEAKTPTTT